MSPANRPERNGEIMADQNQTAPSQSQNGTSGLQLTLAWLFVGIPLTWGVVQTLINAMKLFQ
jgi:hypothetical protein